MKFLLLCLISGAFFSGCNSEKKKLALTDDQSSENYEDIEVYLPNLEYAVKLFQIEKSAYLASYEVYKSTGKIPRDVEIKLSETRDRLKLTEENLNAKIDNIGKGADPDVMLAVKNDIAEYNQSVQAKRDIWIHALKSKMSGAGSEDEVNEAHSEYDAAISMGVFHDVKNVGK